MSQRWHRSGTIRAFIGFAVTSVVVLAFTGMAHAATIFGDGFESGDFSAWTQVVTGGNGTASIQNAHASSGVLAAQMTATATAGSKAYARRTFSTVQQDLIVSGDFKVLTQGPSTQNVPFFRLFDPASARLVSLYRQNGTTGSIELTAGGVRFGTTGRLALNTVATISLHVVINGTSSTVSVRLNGTQIYMTSSANLGTTGVSTVQVGNDTSGQPMNLVVDTIAAQNAAPSEPSPPINTAAPGISGTPQVGQALTATPGEWTGAAPIAYAYAWQRCSGGCAPISGATGATYTVTSADVGSTLRVAVTATNSVGAASATSGATTVVAGPATAPASTSPPTISGTAQSGQMLTASPGAWSGTQPIGYAYQWQRCNAAGGLCAAIAGAAPSYTLTAADVGSTLRVAVTAANSVGPATASSSATAVVQTSATLPGLVALWHMDETSGSVMFDSARSHHGTLRRVALGQPGFAGFAYGFVGKADVTVPHADDLNPGGANVTLTMRVKTTLVPTSDWDVIRKGYYYESPAEYKMEYQPSGQISCGFKGSTGYRELVAGPAINNGVWHTVQCLKTTTGITVVVDGVRSSKSGAVGTISNTDVLAIAARPGVQFFQGSLDEASVEIG